MVWSILGIGIITTLLILCWGKKIGGYRVYKIKAGKHRSTSCVKLLTKPSMMFNAIFDESAIYTSNTPQNQYDINKLYGFSECNQFHHKNSARFGWNWIDGKLNIYTYVYNDGVRSFELITDISLNEPHSFSISKVADKYLFRVDSKVIEMPRTSKCDKGIYYTLFPYFGGDETAPHNITIKIKCS